MLGTISKTAQVLDLFNDQEIDWGTSEVAAAVNIPRSSAHRILSSLVDTGLLQSNRGRYRIGWRVFSLSEIRREVHGFLQIAEEPLDRLAALIDETIHLAALRGWTPICQAVAESDRTVAVLGPRPGDRLPLLTSAVGQVLLAGTDSTEVNSLIELESNPSANQTGTEISTLSARLYSVEAEGYAIDEANTTEGVYCIAAPIRGESGTVISAVAVAVPKVRFMKQRKSIEEAVRNTAREMSMRFGATRGRFKEHDTPPDFTEGEKRHSLECDTVVA